MGMFGWRLTNKKPEVESEIVKDLHQKLEVEQSARKADVDKAKDKATKLKSELAEAKEAEAKRVSVQQNKNRAQAVEHLKAAERYKNSASQAQGARVTQLQAIIDERLEKVKNLGFEVTGNISNMINRLANGS